MSAPSLLYLRDIFSACGILAAILAGADPHRSRIDTILKCLDEIGVGRKLPLQDWRDGIAQNHPKLWLAGDINNKQVKEDERKKGTLSRPLANVTNWVLHIDDPTNAKELLSLPRHVQHLFSTSRHVACRLNGHEGRRVSWALLQPTHNEDGGSSVGEVRSCHPGPRPPGHSPDPQKALPQCAPWPLLLGEAPVVFVPPTTPPRDTWTQPVHHPRPALLAPWTNQPAPTRTTRRRGVFDTKVPAPILAIICQTGAENRPERRQLPVRDGLSRMASCPDGWCGLSAFNECFWPRKPCSCK